jgi:hypothetical protein
MTWSPVTGSGDAISDLNLGDAKIASRKARPQELFESQIGHQAESDPNETKSGFAQDKCPRVHAKDSVDSRLFAWT